MTVPSRVVILGGGPAGLAVAHELSRERTRTTVLERNPYVGGLAATFEHRGYKFDLGGHRWFTKNEELNDWFRNLMAGELVMVNRISRIFHRGKYFIYPIEVWDIIKQTNPIRLASIILSFMWSSFIGAVAPRPIVNMKEAYTAQFGGVLYRMFFERYSEKLWGLPCNELSADWVAQRSRGFSVMSLIKKTLLGPNKNIISLIDRFMYPRNGYGRISERMAEEVIAGNNEILLQRIVSRIVNHGENDFEVFYKYGEQEESLRTDCVVSTLPLGRLVAMLEPTCSPKVLALARSLKFRNIITVNIMLRRGQVSRDTWLYIQDSDIIFGRLHEPKNWSTAMVPDMDHTSLVLECFCSEGDAIWMMSDDQISRRCIDDLADKLAFIDRVEVVDFKVIRVRDAYPVYDLEYKAKLEEIQASLRHYVGLHTVGRGGTFRYNNADHSIEMGLRLARRILGGDDDHSVVNTDADYQEEIRLDKKRTNARYRGV
jgi:protoporphyrinogen oxidase